jgi:hypothetical protein
MFKKTRRLKKGEIIKVIKGYRPFAGTERVPSLLSVYPVVAGTGCFSDAPDSLVSTSKVTDPKAGA